MSRPLSATTTNCLTRAGWTPDRAADTLRSEAALAEDGYEIFPAAVRFLRQFGGLEITHPAYRVPNEWDRSHFDPERAVEGVYRERVATYEERVGEPLIVVGEAYNGLMTLMLSPTGRMYGAYDDYLCLLGETPAEGLDTLCEGSEARVIA